MSNAEFERFERELEALLAPYAIEIAAIADEGTRILVFVDRLVLEAVDAVHARWGEKVALDEDEVTFVEHAEPR